MAGARRIGGRYRLVEPLGSGGMSVVWRGFDEVLQRPVAVKVLAGELATDPGLREAIRREAQAAARVCHPHIANVYDYGESTLDDGGPTPFVVMELVSGEPLSALLAGGVRLPWRQAAGICAQVAAALSEAHAHGVVHRDIKPGNVMIGRSGAKVVDFGISALVGECDLAEDGQLLGTPAYIAPERLGGGRAETASDVYAVGVLLHRALTGRLPWRVDTPQQLIAAHLDAEPPALGDLDELSDVPAEVVTACRECLSREPDRRPRSHELAKVLGEASGAVVEFASPVAPPAVGAAGPATTWLGLEELTPLPRTASLPLVLEGMGRWPAWGLASSPSSWAGPSSWPVTAWLIRSPMGRRVALALLTVVVLGAAAAFGGTRGATPIASSLGDSPPGSDAVGTAKECQVRYQIERDWRTGFAAVVTVTNAGGTDLDAATLRFRFPGEQAIVSGERWQQDGRDVTADLVLPTGKSVRLPFTASYREENPLPLAFLVDGMACDAVVTGPRGAVVGDAAGGESGPGSRDSSRSDSSGPGPGSDGSGHGKKGKKGREEARILA